MLSQYNDVKVERQYIIYWNTTRYLRLSQKKVQTWD